MRSGSYDIVSPVCAVADGPWERVPKRYINMFLRTRSAALMLQVGLYLDAKDITESFASWAAVADHLPEHSFSDQSVGMIAVSDGVAPRTAAMFALRTRWTCYSIDPKLRSGDWERIDRLSCIGQRIESVRLNIERCVVVAVHSHAPLGATLDALPNARRIAVVAMPCCVPQSLDRPPDVEYRDPNVWSPKNTIRVWREAR